MSTLSNQDIAIATAVVFLPDNHDHDNARPDNDVADEAALRPVRDLPSNLTYKDQGRDLESFFPQARPSSPAVASPRLDPPTSPSLPQEEFDSSHPPAESPRQILVSRFPRTPVTNSPRPGKRALLGIGILCVAVAILVVVAVLVATMRGGGSSSEGITAPTPNPTTPAPTLWPTTTRKPFTTKEELEVAIKAYQADNSTETLVAQIYGHPIGSWDVSRIGDMSFLFAGKSNNRNTFNEDISNWDVSRVTNMFGMFEYSEFNRDISKWRVDSVTNMGHMFHGASAFDQPLNDWNVSAVTNMEYMFYFASSFHQPLDNWNVAAVTQMQLMFYLAASFNSDLCPWGVLLAKPTNVTSVFSASGCQSVDDPVLSASPPGPFCHPCTN